MFGIGFPELVVIAFVAVLVFGPDRLPGLAKQAAHLLKAAKRFADNARDELRDELGPEFADLELRDLDPREIMRKHIAEAMADDDDTISPVTPLETLPAGQRPPYDDEAT